MIQYTKKDVERLRDLGRKVHELAELPIQKERIALWTNVNDLRMTKPVLYHRDTPAAVLNDNNELTTQIEDPFWNKVEADLLMRLYNWKHMPLDYVVEDSVKCECAIHDNGWGELVMYDSDLTKDRQGQATVHFKALINTMDDVEKIKTPVVEHDEAETKERWRVMNEIFDGILKVRLHGRCYWNIAPWDDILEWMGMGDAMMRFYEDPDLMHACAKRYIDCSIEWYKKYESMGLLSSNNGYENILNNNPGYTTELPAPPEGGIGCKLKDIWGACSDQIMTSVSPATSREFGFAYEKEFAKLFGKFGYGCCERLDHKMLDVIDAFPNLRMVSVSPFSKPEPALEALGSKYVACFKPNSNYLFQPNFEDAKEHLTKEMENILQLSQKYNTNLVINMKTIITLRDEPQRLWWWSEMAREMVEKYYN
ncbi:hypothetical protein [Oscillibacter sp.]|uniref:hypothetical protein n=1 Tax=Oscillibacter sp. TaxID=1945593 RepID=UPI00261E865F|nr:hypothetical protein [Oscillibacter sp.]MDD3347216.1 hypothetical protein [Oscillibacter sp.]